MKESDEIGKKMSVVGEEGISLEDIVVFLKGEFYDSVFLQQNAFDKVDTTCDVNRQLELAEVVGAVIDTNFNFNTRDDARKFFVDLSNQVIQWNYTAKGDPDYKVQKNAILEQIRGEKE